MQVNAHLENHKESVAAEQAKKKQALKNIAEIEGAIAKKEKDAAKKSAQFATQKAAFAALEDALAAAEKQREAAALGLADDGLGGASKTFADQLRDAERAESVASTAVQQARSYTRVGGLTGRPCLPV